jgi:hypothetical protein
MMQEATESAAKAADSFQCSFNEEDCELCAWILELLRGEEFEAVAQSIVYLESKGSKLEIEGFANLRDAFSHLSLAVQSGISQEKRTHQKTEVREHLRRAFTHPFQDAIDSELAKLERRKWLFMLRHQIVGNDIVSPREYYKRLDRIKNEVFEVRLIKGQNKIVESASRFRQCYDDLQQLKFDMEPSKGVLFVRIVGAAVLIIISLVLQAIFF